MPHPLFMTVDTFLARDVIYTFHTYAMMSMSICLSVTEVHWRIIANFGFNSDPNLPRIAVAVYAGARDASSPGRVEGSSRAILATARPSCQSYFNLHFVE